MCACPAGYEFDEDDFDDWDDDDGDLDVSTKFKTNSSNDSKVKVEKQTLPELPSEKKSWVPNSFKKDDVPAVIKSGDILNLTNDYKNCVQWDRADQVQSFLDNGIDVDIILHVGWNALMYAGNSGSSNAMKVLIDNKANVNFHKDRYSVLMATCGSKRSTEESLLKCVELLVENEANINEFDRCHTSALMYASREGRPLIVQYLIENKANINKQDNRGFSSLTWAAHLGHLRVVQVLLQGGADVNLQSCDGSRPIDVAMSQGKELVVKMLQTYGSGTYSNDALSAIVTINEEEVKKETITQKYGDLEIFLSGLQLSELISKFHENKVTFEQFLRLTDGDLLRIGVSKLGQRKQIIDSIRDTHKKDWENSSMIPVHYNKTIKCPDAVAMVSNTSKHISYITCSIGYISDQFMNNKEVLHTGVAGATVRELINVTDETMANIKDLYAELRTFNIFLAQASAEENYDPPDFIDFTKEFERKMNKKSRKKTVMKYFGFIAVIGVITYNKDKLLDFTSNLYNML